MNVKQYIKWYNSQERRMKCPECDEPMTAKENVDDEVFLDLNHTPDCKLSVEWKHFSDINPEYSPGGLFLKWIHRND